MPSLSDLTKGVKRGWDGSRDALGNSTVGAIIGAVLAPYTGGASMAWGGAIGGAIGGGYEGGTQGALQGGMQGYMLGSGIGSLSGSTASAAPIKAAGAPPSVSATPAPAPGIGAAPPPPSALPPNPTGSGFAGQVGIQNSNVGVAALNAPSIPAPPVVSAQLPAAKPAPATVAPQQPVVPNTVAEAPADVPWHRSKATQVLSGLPYLLGLGEDPNYDDVYSPDPEPSVVDEYYDDVAKYGIANVPVPPELRRTPAARRTDFGSKRSTLKRRA